MEYEAGKCPGCGGQVSETTAAANEFRYHVLPPKRCHLCTALEIAQQKAGSDKNLSHQSALLWSVDLHA